MDKARLRELIEQQLLRVAKWEIQCERLGVEETDERFRATLSAYIESGKNTLYNMGMTSVQVHQALESMKPQVARICDDHVRMEHCTKFLRYMAQAKDDGKEDIPLIPCKERYGWCLDCPEFEEVCEEERQLLWDQLGLPSSLDCS